MKNGEKITCPHCGEKSFAREKKEFDDNFSLKNSSFVCALCGRELKGETAEKGAGKSSDAAERLSALLGGEKMKKVTFAPEADDGKVCLHCRHYIKHPFFDRCGITMKEIEVLDSCEKFEARDE